LPNYRVTVSKRRNICENGPVVDLGMIGGDVRSNKRNTSRPGSAAEDMPSRKRSISIQSDGDPTPPTKRRRLQRRQQKLQSTPPVSDSEGIQSSVSVPRNDILQRYDCKVCLENLDSTSFYNRKLEIYCGHLNRVCVNCIQKWISSTLEANGPVNIRCPLCPQELTYDNIRSLATNDIFTRYITSIPSLTMLILWW
jgi:hypothetical protein